MAEPGTIQHLKYERMAERRAHIQRVIDDRRRAEAAILAEVKTIPAPNVGADNAERYDHEE
jgi:hypothetical protein